MSDRITPDVISRMGLHGEVSLSPVREARMRSRVLTRASATSYRRDWALRTGVSIQLGGKPASACPVQHK